MCIFSQNFTSRLQIIVEDFLSRNALALLNNGNLIWLPSSY